METSHRHRKKVAGRVTGSSVSHCGTYGNISFCDSHERTDIVRKKKSGRGKQLGKGTERRGRAEREGIMIKDRGKIQVTQDRVSLQWIGSSLNTPT